MKKPVRVPRKKKKTFIKNHGRELYDRALKWALRTHNWEFEYKISFKQLMSK